MIPKINNQLLEQNADLNRRAWLKKLGGLTASGLLLSACGEQFRAENMTTMPSSNSSSADLINDGGLLNAALALEHEAIALYGAAATLPFMQVAAVKPVLDIAVAFKTHHEQHRDSLISVINGLRQKDSRVAAPVAARSVNEYVSPFVSKLVDVPAVLRLASLKESGAAQAYLGLISEFRDKNLAEVSGMLGGDEAAHYGVLRAALFALFGDTQITAQTVIPSSLPGGFSQNF